MTFWWWHSYTWLMDASSPVYLHLLSFYDFVMFFVIIIGVFVVVCLVYVVSSSYTNMSVIHNSWAETGWTMGPIIILLLLGIPSLHLLYMMDEVKSPILTVKAIGHQWYWSYEYSDCGLMSFDSYMVNESDLFMGEYRSLDVDNRMVMPSEVNVRLLTTATDVIHSWWVPGLGVKIDSIPGRLNQVNLFTDRAGVFYGQCAEICGANHAFMPIVIEAVPCFEFSQWLELINKSVEVVPVESVEKSAAKRLFNLWIKCLKLL